MRASTDAAACIHRHGNRQGKRKDAKRRGDGNLNPTLAALGLSRTVRAMLPPAGFARPAYLRYTSLFC
jgi:hypothetical protein